MALPKTEAFTDTDSTDLESHDANWVNNQGTQTINSNTVYHSSASDFGLYSWQGDSFNDSQYAKIKLTGLNATNRFMGVGSRIAAGSADGYYFFASTNASYFGKAVSGSWTDIGSDRGTFSVNDTIGIQWDASDGFSLRKNDVEIDSGTDSTFSSGYAGVATYASTPSTGTNGDDWEGGNVSAGSSASAAGALSSAGALTRKFTGSRSAAAALSISGALTRKFMASRSTAGALSFSGSVAYSLGLIQQAVAGALSFAGALVGRYKAHRSVSGVISSSGSLSQKSKFVRSIAGVLSMAGSATRKIRYFRTITGSIAIAGAVAWVSGQLIGGVIAFAGALTARAIFRRSTSGSIGPVGDGSKSFAKFYRLVVGTLTPLGAVPMGDILKKGLLRLGKAFNLR